MNPAAFPPPPPGPPTAHRRTLRPPRGRARLVLLALVLLALAIGGYVTTRGGWVNALSLPPTLDAATPRAQNGWVLEDIQLPGQHQDFASRGFSGFQYKQVDFEAREGWTLKPDTQDAFGLWLTPPLGSVAVTASFDSANNTDGKQVSITARLSTGELLPLEWHLRSQEQWTRPGETGVSFLFVALPTGYPNTCRFVDFDVSDQHGHAAHWRITRLPRMRHAVPPPAKVTDSVTENGITMSAKAWHQQDWQSNSSIETILHPVLPANSHQWDVNITRREPEWEAFGTDGRDHGSSSSGPPILGRNGVFSTQFEQWFGGGILGYAGSDPYPRTTRFVRIDTELRQFETYDEPTTFHNIALGHEGRGYYLVIPEPLSITTPSGVTITLPAQGKPRDGSLGEGISVLVKVRPSINSDLVPSPLPNSPLARIFGKPVRLSLIFPQPYSASSWSYMQNGAPADYGLSLPRDPKDFRKILPPPPVLKDFTMIVRQRVDIQTIPMTFTLSIADHSPPYYPKGFRIPKR